MSDWIDRTDALARLGVRAQTLYAYVSRGQIGARPDPDDPRRSSLYEASGHRAARRAAEAAAQGRGDRRQRDQLGRALDPDAHLDDRPGAG